MSGKFMDIESIRGDEYFTLDKDAETIAKYIIHPMTIWLPFNDRGNAFDRVLPKYGHQVICTESDFFTTPPPNRYRSSCQQSSIQQKEGCHQAVG